MCWSGLQRRTTSSDLRLSARDCCSGSIPSHVVSQIPTQPNPPCCSACYTARINLWCGVHDMPRGTLKEEIHMLCFLEEKKCYRAEIENEYH